ncbi:nuclear transport factor 2 family protein [Parafrankia sp. FMc2]|uniref:nuclear transport factor 2 family protein n=1 Tax=Parafrankia sp. FMc2 TaxID=3233196 RepID=UPI0034D79E7B
MDSAELHTRIGVGDLLARYQYLADAGKIRQLSELFAEDAEYVTNRSEWRGPAGVLDFFRSTKDSFVGAGFLPARHYLSSVLIRPRPDGSASTYACFQYIGVRGLDHWGTYVDEVVPDGDGWKFRRRVATVEGCVATSPVVGLLGIEARV